jgi:hypothetical protein
MKTEIKLISYTDPSHGWLRVPLKMLVKLGIADKISPFSYVRTVYAYLEEDVDAALFLKTLEAKGKTVKFVTRHTNRYSRIRNYDSYTFKIENPSVSNSTEVVDVEIKQVDMA